MRELGEGERALTRGGEGEGALTRGGEGEGALTQCLGFRPSTGAEVFTESVSEGNGITHYY